MEFTKDDGGRDPKALAQFVAKKKPAFGAASGGEEKDEGGAEAECPKCGHKFEVKE